MAQLRPALLALLASLLFGCGDPSATSEGDSPSGGSGAGAEGPAGAGPADPPDREPTEGGGAAGEDARSGRDREDPRFQLVDEALERGLSHPNHCGDPEHKRYLLETIGQGVALLDFDLDGQLDIYTVDGCALRKVEEEGRPLVHVPAMDGHSRLYHNQGAGRSFVDVSERTGTQDGGMGGGAIAADYDGDGDPDLFVTAWGPNRLYRNDAVAEGSEGGAAGRRFVDVAAEAGVDDPRWSTGSCWLDADRDGDLDLYVANYFAMTLEGDPDCWLKVDCPWHDMAAACGPKGMIALPDVFYRNDGAGRFEDATAAAGMDAVESRYGLGVVSLDYDLDGDPDVYVANDSRGNFLFENDGGGVFEDMADLLGVSVDGGGTAQAGMGIGCGDVDGDGDEDLFLTNFSHDYNTLYRNDRDQLGFLDVTRRSGFGQDSYLALGWGTEFTDLDNDGRRELLVANGHVYPEADQRAPEMTYKQLNRVFVMEGGTVVDVTTRAGPGLQRLASSRGLAVGDLDDDGDLDVVVVELNERPSLLINHLPADAGGHLQISLQGAGKNPDAIGARVEVHRGGQVLSATRRSGQSYVSSHDPRLHFGLGAAEQVDRVVVHWPSGAVGEYGEIAANQWVRLREGHDEVEVLRR